MTENNHVWIHHTVILKHITAALHFVYNHRQLWRDTLGNSFYLDKWRKKSDIRINMCQNLCRLHVNVHETEWVKRTV